MTAKEHLDKHDRPLDKHDRQVAAIRALIQEGRRIGIETRKDFRIITAMQKETAAAQKATEASLKALIDYLRGEGNGHINGHPKRKA